MKNITLNQIRSRLIGIHPTTIEPLLVQTPKPFPGKWYPTRVAWIFKIQVQQDERLRNALAEIVDRRARRTGRPVVDVLRDPDIAARMAPRQATTRSFSYIGKPCRYRAIEARKFLQRRPGETLIEYIECEFDRGGFTWVKTLGNVPVTGNVQMVYHPHSSVGPVDFFNFPIYSKRVGGVTLYSYKDRLSAEEVDAFYTWYEQLFKQKLKRPKPTKPQKVYRPLLEDDPDYDWPSF